MATQTITVVRIYLREGEHLLTSIFNFLHDQEHVSGVTVLRGIAGFGPDGKLHTSSLAALSLDLPLIVEFYDVPERIESILKHLETITSISHVISWQAISHIKDR
jgi:PII-like signaling protein